MRETESCSLERRYGKHKQITETRVVRFTWRLTAVITALGATALTTASSAEAWEYCRRDVTGHMLGCSFSSMEQCEATRSGIGGDCLRDPFLPNSRSVHAFQAGRSKRSRGARGVRSGVR